MECGQLTPVKQHFSSGWPARGGGPVLLFELTILD